MLRFQTAIRTYLAGTGAGIILAQSKVLVGGDSAGARNVISGNILDGMHLYGYYQYPDADLVTVQGNYIGTAADGVTPIGNGGYS